MRLLLAGEEALYKYESRGVAQNPGGGFHMSRWEPCKTHSGVNEFPFLQCDKVESTVVPVDTRALKGESVRTSIGTLDGNKGRVERKVIILALTRLHVVLHR